MSLRPDLPDPETVSDIIRETADQYILPRFQELSQNQIYEKAPGDLVTDADIEAEAALTEALTALLPGSRVVGEEAAEHDSSILELLLPEHGDSAPVWVIDPVDGTSNFINGDRRFAVMVALVYGSETRASWIYDPLESRMYRVADNSVYRNNELLELFQEQADPEAYCQHTQFENAGNKGWLQAIREKGIEPCYLRCSGHNFLNVLEGRAVAGISTLCKPWDYMPGLAMIHALGGTSGYADTGAPYTPGRIRAPFAMARNASLWKRVCEGYPSPG